MPWFGILLRIVNTFGKMVEKDVQMAWWSLLKPSETAQPFCPNQMAGYRSSMEGKKKKEKQGDQKREKKKKKKRKKKKKKKRGKKKETTEKNRTKERKKSNGKKNSRWFELGGRVGIFARCQHTSSQNFRPRLSCGARRVQKEERL